MAVWQGQLVVRFSLFVCPSACQSCAALPAALTSLRLNLSICQECVTSGLHHGDEGWCYRCVMKQELHLVYWWCWSWAALSASGPETPFKLQLDDCSCFNPLSLPITDSLDVHQFNPVYWNEMHSSIRAHCAGMQLLTTISWLWRMFFLFLVEYGEIQSALCDYVWYMAEDKCLNWNHIEVVGGKKEELPTGQRGKILQIHQRNVQH